MSDKTILEQWRAIAYDQQADRNKLQRFWANYFNIEKGIYEQLLSNPDEVAGCVLFHVPQIHMRKSQLHFKAVVCRRTGVMTYSLQVFLKHVVCPVVTRLYVEDEFV